LGEELTASSLWHGIPLVVPVSVSDLPKEWGPRNTRKDAKGEESRQLGGPSHNARPDIRRGRDTLQRDPALHVQKTCDNNI